MEWISDIKLVPFRHTEIINYFKYGQGYTLNLYKPLNIYNMNMKDHV